MQACDSADFILRDMESILVEWEAFAATLFPATTSMTSLALRDHAKQILEAVAKDLSTPQTKQAQADKSLGRAPKPMEAPETAAQTHAYCGREVASTSTSWPPIDRALRASVLRLWTDACQPDELDLEDVIRFNEAIDQALAESIGFFSAQVDRARNFAARNAGPRHAQPAKRNPDDSLVPGRIERRDGGIRSGGEPSPQWSFHQRAAGRLSRFQSH